LTRQQIDKYDHPPNPAKLTDPRAGKFLENHGDTSWEVDALRPEVLNDIVVTAIENLINIETYDDIVSEEAADVDILKKLKKHL